MIKKLKNTLTFAAVVCGILICTYATASAQQFTPRGSYKQTCSRVAAHGSTLTANCETPNSGTISSELADFFECDGDVANNQGTLACKRNPNSTIMVKAKTAIESAFKSVLGFTKPPATYKPYLRQIFAAGMGQQFFAGSLPSLDDFFLTLFTKPEFQEAKASYIEKAFKDVYGFFQSDPKDFALYNSQKISYAGIVSAETAKLNSNSTVRRVMINTVFKKVFGRAANADDYAYWTKDPQNFKQMVDTNRIFLYTPGGAGYLVAAVKIALSNKMNGEPTSDQIKSAIVKYTQTKSIYDEM